MRKALSFIGKMKKKTMEDNLDKKIMSNEITIKARPSMEKYDGTTLIGRFDIDAEGVVPDKELTFVDKGILKTLLNGRVPTLKDKTVERIRQADG